MENQSETEMKRKPVPAEFENLYDESDYWHVNTGDETIHAKRIPGKFRNIKWFTASLYLLYFIAPYFRWEGRQAILLDIPARKYHIFSLTIWPQDIWMLSLLLLTFFLSLFAMTAVAGRVFCGYICWQTVWVDIFTWIEEKLEGQPAQRRALDAAPMSGRKLAIKGAKHAIYLALCLLTGITFTSYFIDTGDLWHRYLTLEGPIHIWVTPMIFTIFSYLGVAIMREQVCFWLCPYARIQSVMTDMDSVLPTYDEGRGEPRGKIKKQGAADKKLGDCVDCNLCVAVCPTGVDIRRGQQEGCITCGLCIDACDTIMEKVGRPKGLVRYMSLRETQGEALAPLYKRPRVIVYTSIMLAALSGVVYGVTHLKPMAISVIHERQPLWVELSDGSIQNTYVLKALNKTDADMDVKISVTGVKNARLDIDPGITVHLEKSKVTPMDTRVKAMMEDFGGGSVPIYFRIENINDPKIYAVYESAFIGPKK